MGISKELVRYMLKEKKSWCYVVWDQLICDIPRGYVGTHLTCGDYGVRYFADCQSLQAVYSQKETVETSHSEREPFTLLTMYME